MIFNSLGCIYMQNFHPNLEKEPSNKIKRCCKKTDGCGDPEEFCVAPLGSEPEAGGAL